MRRNDVWITGTVLIVLGSLGNLQAQDPTDRYELGWHLRRFEEALVQCSDGNAKSRCIPALNRAFTAFFNFKVPQASRELDLATRILLGRDPSPAQIRWADSLWIQPNRRLFDTDQETLRLSIKPFYASMTTPPRRYTLRVQLGQQPPQDFVINQEMASLCYRLPTWTEKTGADLTLTTTVLADGQELLKRAQTLSRVPQLSKRLTALEAEVSKLPKVAATLEAATLRELYQTLAALQAGESLETDYPAALLLRQAESLIGAMSAQMPYFRADQPGQYWLRIPSKDRETPARLLIPANVDPKQPTPLVVALHGAGGSENKFFESYGAGLIVQLCKQRGWYLLAPRSGNFLSAPPVEQLVERLAMRFPVDRQQVYLLGHSMGAAQALSLAQKAKHPFAGIVLLAGSGRLTNLARLKRLPIFIGCGKADFTFAAASKLQKQLQASNLQQVTFRAYPEVEHLMIVAVALNDVFAWLDQLPR